MTMRALNRSLILASNAGAAGAESSTAAPMRSCRSVQLAGMYERDSPGRISNRWSWPPRLQRLSTGLKINTGADNPAGLIASENLRAEKALCALGRRRNKTRRG